MLKTALPIAAIALLSITALAGAADRGGSGADPTGDSRATTADFDLVSTGFTYASSTGHIRFTARVAAPFTSPDRVAVSFDLTECDGDQANRDTQVRAGYTSQNGASTAYGSAVPPARGPSGTVAIDGDTITYDVSSPQFAGHDYTCLATGIGQIFVSPDGANTKSSGIDDRAVAGAPGVKLPGPGITLASREKSVEADDSNDVLLKVITGDATSGSVTIKTTRKLRLTPKSRAKIVTIGRRTFKPRTGGNATDVEVRLTKAALKLFDRYPRVGTTVTLAAADSQGNRSVTTAKLTVLGPPA
jgi:hypothetical protein